MSNNMVEISKKQLRKRLTEEHNQKYIKKDNLFIRKLYKFIKITSIVMGSFIFLALILLLIQPVLISVIFKKYYVIEFFLLSFGGLFLLHLYAERLSDNATLKKE